MVLDFSLELKVVEDKSKELENCLKENREGKDRIVYIFIIVLVQTEPS